MGLVILIQIQWMTRLMLVVIDQFDLLLSADIWFKLFSMIISSSRNPVLQGGLKNANCSWHETWYKNHLVFLDGKDMCYWALGRLWWLLTGYLKDGVVFDIIFHSGRWLKRPDIICLRKIYSPWLGWLGSC